MEPRLIELGVIDESVKQYFLGGGGESSIGSRRALIKNGMKLFWDSGGLGVGAGAGEVAQQRMGTVRGLSSMHNFWIEILVDGGIVGFTIFFLFALSNAVNMLRISRHSESQVCAMQASALVLSYVVFSVGCISASSVIYFMPMWILFGMSIALARICRRAAAY